MDSLCIFLKNKNIKKCQIMEKKAVLQNHFMKVVHLTSAASC